MKFFFIRIGFLFFLLLLGCEKKEVSIPTITIQTPSGSVFLAVPDTIEITATVSDPDLQNINVTLVNSDYLPVGTTINVQARAPLTAFNILFPVFDVNLPSGNYFIRIRASNTDEQRSAWIPVRLQQPPLERKGLLVTTGQNFNAVTQFVSDSVNIVLYNGPIDHRNTLTSNGNQAGYLVPATNGAVQGFDLKNNQIAFSIPAQTSGGAATFIAAAASKSNLWLSLFDGRVARYRLDGQQDRLFFLPTNERAVKLAANEDYLVSATQPLAGGQTTLRVWGASTGYQWHDVGFASEISAFTFRSKTLLLFALKNLSGSYALLEMNLISGQISTLVPVIKDPIWKMLTDENGFTAALTPVGIYRVLPNGNLSANPLVLGSFQDFALDPADNLIWVASGTQINAVPYNGGAPQPRYNLMQPILGFDVLMSR